MLYQTLPQHILTYMIFWGYIQWISSGIYDHSTTCKLHRNIIWKYILTICYGIVTKCSAYVQHLSVCKCPAQAGSRRIGTAGTKVQYHNDAAVPGKPPQRDHREYHPPTLGCPLEFLDNPFAGQACAKTAMEMHAWVSIHFLGMHTGIVYKNDCHIVT